MYLHLLDLSPHFSPGPPRVVSVTTVFIMVVTVDLSNTQTPEYIAFRITIERDVCLCFVLYMGDPNLFFFSIFTQPIDYLVQTVGVNLNFSLSKWFIL